MYYILTIFFTVLVLPVTISIMYTPLPNFEPSKFTMLFPLLMVIPVLISILSPRELKIENWALSVSIDLIATAKDDLNGLGKMDTFSGSAVNVIVGCFSVTMELKIPFSASLIVTLSVPLPLYKVEEHGSK